MCIRYMPKVSFDKRVIHAGERSMQVNSIKAPKVAKSTLGVQNSHDHSAIGVSRASYKQAECANTQALASVPVDMHTDVVGQDQIS